MHIAYPALFYYDPNESTKYFVYFPDFNSSGTQGIDVADAMRMAAEWLGLEASACLHDGKELPKPSNLNKVSLVNDDPFKDDPDFALDYDLEQSFASMVAVDLKEYLNYDEPVKKTVTIPKWADDLATNKKVDFSKLLTEAIAKID